MHNTNRPAKNSARKRGKRVSFTSSGCTRSCTIMADELGEDDGEHIWGALTSAMLMRLSKHDHHLVIAAPRTVRREPRTGSPRTGCEARRAVMASSTA